MKTILFQSSQTHYNNTYSVHDDVLTGSDHQTVDGSHWLP